MHLQIMKFARVYAGEFGSVYTQFDCACVWSSKTDNQNTADICQSLENHPCVSTSY